MKKKIEDAEPGYCPILKIETTSQVCNNSNCIYRDESSGRCNQMLLTESLPEDTEERMKLVCSTFRVTPEEVLDSQTRIREALELNRFFEFLFGKPILDAKSREISELTNSMVKYKAWKGKSSIGGPIPFSRIASMAVFVETKL